MKHVSLLPNPAIDFLPKSRRWAVAFVESIESSTQGRRCLRTRSPVDGRVLNDFDVANAEDVAAAMARARAAQPSTAPRPNGHGSAAALASRSLLGPLTGVARHFTCDVQGSR